MLQEFVSRCIRRPVFVRMNGKLCSGQIEHINNIPSDIKEIVLKISSQAAYTLPINQVINEKTIVILILDHQHKIIDYFALDAEGYYEITDHSEIAERTGITLDLVEIISSLD